MDCKRAERLMPLYAGNDLEANRARNQLAAHLRACNACRRLAAEWAEARSLLSLHEPPEFNAAFFDAVRRSVLQEITAPPAPPRIATLFAQLLGPKALACAATLALLIVAFASAALYQRAGRPLAKVASRAASDLRVLSVVPPGDGTRPEDVSSFDPPAPTPLRHKPVRRKRITRSKGDALTADISTPVADPSEEAVAQTKPEASQPLQSQDIISPQPAHDDDAMVETARNYLRIELQTRNPNVRIIWLSPQPNERPLKGRHDNR